MIEKYLHAMTDANHIDRCTEWTKRRDFDLNFIARTEVRGAAVVIVNVFDQAVDCLVGWLVTEGAGGGITSFAELLVLTTSVVHTDAWVGILTGLTLASIAVAVGIEQTWDALRYHTLIALGTSHCATGTSHRAVAAGRQGGGLT